MTAPLPQHAPFSCTYSPQVPELLRNLQCSLVISTYQAGKIIFLSPKNNEQLVQMPRTFDKPMGISVCGTDHSLALATKNEIIVFADSKDLARHYPKSPDTYDALYMPRMTYHTGPLDLHDLHYDGSRVLAVNSLFSCIARVDARFNFTPEWMPSFISALVSEDRCHLNGMAVADGEVVYATAFGTGDTFQSWRENVTTTGVVMDTRSNEICCGGLAMPHSPRVYNHQLYLLLSASGELVRVDAQAGKYETVARPGGFLRGLACYQDYAFIGRSKLRKNSSTFGHLDIPEEMNYASVIVVHIPTGAIAGELRYHTSVDEIYDVQVLPGKMRPNILNTTDNFHNLGIATPEHTFWARPDELKKDPS